ncbi:hypothetical protein Tsubulata_000285 [Turnera subulata]|uniref:Transmembrane protein 53 n=1 Tax=Turnera subulata TaxID=218843 RepID=A0A9Q0F105_9ROSI|nr:hypothetical protein Tsubulata_000285 [Turnera subulata]
MEAPVRLFSRQFLTKSHHLPTPNRLNPHPFPHRFINPTKHPHLISTPKPIRVRSLFSPPGNYSPITPNPNPINFLLSLSSSHLSNPSPQNPDFTSQSNASSRLFAWHRAPDPAANEFSGLGGKPGPVVTVVLLGWLGAQRRHLRKYVEWYNGKGFHAVTFVVDPRELLCFDLGRRVEARVTELANELVSWVSGREDDGRERRLVFHTFSNTGWFAYGYILDIMQGREELLEKIAGCVFDSGGGGAFDPKVWAGGFSAALLKNRSSATLRSAEINNINGLDNQSGELGVKEKPQLFESLVLSALEKLFSVILKLSDVDQKLKKIFSILSTNQPPCPQLYLYSTADKVVPFQSIEMLIEGQRKMGRKVLSYNFRSSPHVDHYRTFPDTYLSVLHSFLKECFATVKQK